MKIDNDREEDILTIELHTAAPIEHTEQVSSLILDVDPDDKPVLLEILEASEFLAAIVKNGTSSRFCPNHYVTVNPTNYPLPFVPMPEAYPKFEPRVAIPAISSLRSLN